MSSSDYGYLFGCCAACRAPFEPSDPLVLMYPESQSVLYMMSRFMQLSRSGKINSEFTGRKHNSHLVTRAKYSVALSFAIRKLPQDRVDKGLPSWNADPNRIRFDADDIFKTQVNASAKGRKALKDVETGATDPEIQTAVEEARTEADSTATDTDFAKVILSKLSGTADNLYMAAWDQPSTDVNHTALFTWLAATSLNEMDVNLDRVTACCSLCNNIWDCFARMRDTFGSSEVVPPRTITVHHGRTNTLFPQPGKDSAMLSRLGCMVCYYLHACLRKLHDALPTLADKADRLAEGRRPVTVMLLWLPLHINCMYQELEQPLNNPTSPNKGFHNYVGCLDLLISYYVYLCACADPDVAFSGFPFEKFHVLYMKELAECPAPAWPDRTAHSRVHEYIFDDAYRGLGKNYAAQIGAASDKLQSLYHAIVKPLLGFMRGTADPPANLAPASEFFITNAEAQALTRDYVVSSAKDVDNLRTHLSHVGIHAIMWQLRRALQRDGKQYAVELDRWINARMQVEWRNIAASGFVARVADAQLVYYAQHTLQPPGGNSLLALADAAAEDPGEAIQALHGLGLCSIWKAAHRLRAWGFAAPPAVVAEVQDDDDEDVEGISAGLGGLRITAGLGGLRRNTAGFRGITSAPARITSAPARITNAPARITSAPARPSAEAAVAAPTLQRSAAAPRSYAAAGAVAPPRRWPPSPAASARRSTA